MKSFPKVSVIILTLQSERYIARALNSVVLQNYSDIEILVIDAGSKDNTESIVRSYNFTQWFVLEKSDMGFARQFGVMKSTGDYVMFLDSDDYYLANKIKHQVKLLETKNNIDFVASKALVFKDSPERVAIKNFTNKKLNLRDLLEGKMYTLSAFCFRRTVFENVCFETGQRGFYGEDWSLQLKIFIQNIPYDFDENVFVAVELRNNSFAQWENQWRVKLIAYEILKESLPKLNSEDIKLKQFIDEVSIVYQKKLLLSYILVKRYDEALSLLLSSEIINCKDRLYLFPLIVFGKYLYVDKIVKILWILRQRKSFNWQFSEKDNLNWYYDITKSE